MARTPKLVDQVRAAVLNDGWKIDRSYRSSKYEAYHKSGTVFTDRRYMFIGKHGALRIGDTIANSLPVNPQTYIKRVYNGVNA